MPEAIPPDRLASMLMIEADTTRQPRTARTNLSAWAAIDTVLSEETPMTILERLDPQYYYGKLAYQRESMMQKNIDKILLNK